DKLVGGRIDKISQPTYDSIVIALRSGGSNHKLLISAEASGAKLHLTKSALENPHSAPMFCMLLRKHLGGGKLLRTEQLGLDRILTIVFEATNELGDRVELSLVCEIMGRRSNIILVNADGKIIDAIKRVDFVTSEVRQILSGLTYTLPPTQQKRNPLITPAAELSRAVCEGRDIPLSKALLEVVEGLSPMLAREISCFVCGAADLTVSELDATQRERLTFYIGVFQTALGEDGGEPWLIRDQTGKAVDFCFIEPRQFPDDYRLERGEGFSALLDSFYRNKDVAERIRQKSGDLHKLLGVVRDRVARKLAAQKQELLQSCDREEKKQWGDIISANIYQMQKGDEILRTVNFFSEEQEEVEIPLDPMLTPAKNAQRYYGIYRKAATAEAKLRELIESGEHELAYLETVIGELDRAESDAELQAIRAETAAQGYSRLQGKDQNRKPVKLSPHRYLSSDGFIILSGRNNLQNDQLTLKDATNYDLWLHTQKIPGSHTIVLTDGCRELPSRTIEEAAVIAACNSSARNSSKVPVDYTYVKNVKKPRGAKPGMVIYETYQTAIVEPDRERAEALRSK
ncbi:MAG: NFACT RNA binding domain-containing protein, partial [Angelakisella sp.]